MCHEQEIGGDRSQGQRTAGGTDLDAAVRIEKDGRNPVITRVQRAEEGSQRLLVELGVRIEEQHRAACPTATHRLVDRGSEAHVLRQQQRRYAELGFPSGYTLRVGRVVDDEYFVRPIKDSGSEPGLDVVGAAV